MGKSDKLGFGVHFARILGRKYGPKRLLISLTIINHPEIPQVETLVSISTTSKTSKVDF
jgi:hypothetical protein